MTGLHLVALLPLVNRATVKPLLTVLVLVAASVSYFTSHYGTYFDTHMIDNVLQTDSREASELLTPGFALYLLLFALLPLTLLWRWPLRQCGWQRGLGAGALWWLSSVTVLAGVLLFSFQGLSALMRNHHGPCSMSPTMANRWARTASTSTACPMPSPRRSRPACPWCGGHRTTSPGAQG